MQIDEKENLQMCGHDGVLIPFHEMVVNGQDEKNKNKQLGFI